MPPRFKYPFNIFLPLFPCIILTLLLAACENGTVSVSVSTPSSTTSTSTAQPATSINTAQGSVTTIDTITITIPLPKGQPETGCFNNLTLPKQTGRIIWPSSLQLYADSTCKKAVEPEGNKNNNAYLFATLPTPTSQQVTYSLALNTQTPVSQPSNSQKIAFTTETQKYVELTPPTTFGQGQCLPIKIPANTYHIVWKPDMLVLFLGKTCGGTSVPYQLINGQAHEILPEPTTVENDYSIFKSK